MSNIGLNSIPFSDRVLLETQVLRDCSVSWICGPLATWKYKIEKPFLLEDSKIAVAITLPEMYSLSHQFNKKAYKPLENQWSTNCVTIQKQIKSSDVGFKKYLRVIGVGYKFSEENSNELQVQVGFTHLLKQKIHPLLQIKATRKKRMIRVRSISFSELTNSLSCLRNKRKPNVFTGKGLRFRKQKVWRKMGKKKKT